MGTDTPIAVLSEPAAAALRLLHPAVRAGDEPAARRHPRGAGHLARHRPSARGQRCSRRRRRTRASWSCRSRSSTTTSSPRSSTSTPTATCPGTRRTSSAASTRSTAAPRRCTPGSRRSSLEVSEAIRRGARFVVLSDRDSGRDLAPIPSLLLTSAVHHHLIREKTRTRVGLLVEAGDVREVHHVALLVGLRRGGGQPLPRDGVGRGPRPLAARITGVAAGEGGREPHQGARQGRPQGDVEDGHLDRRVLPRRPGVRGDRPVAGASSTATSPAPSTQLGGVGLDVVADGGRRPARGGLPAGRASTRRTASSTSAASTSGAARASRTCSTPRRSSGCSTPPAPRRYDIFKQYTSRVDEQSERLMTLRGLFEFAPGDEPAARRPGRGGRAGQRDRQAVQHRRDELRLDQPGGARDPRHRHEPARRQVQHRRGRRGRGPAARPGAPLARSSRSPPAGSA